jgi:oxygen-independent coproporphyrinogen-3 oxidase
VPLPIAESIPATLTLNPSALPAAGIEGLYVHVPFCFHKCHYCDFYSITRQTPDRMDRFVELILREADGWIRARPGEPIRPRTIFFGGGTPSLLPIRAMERLLVGLKQRFDLSAVEEWTVEVNPATASGEYCSLLREQSVDRLSFGAQSFRIDELAALERHHDPQDVSRSLELARAAGFGRMNVDLIYAIPGQSLADWCYSLETAISLGTSHLSCYGLTYESNTPMAVKKRLGVIQAVDEGVELEMLHHTRRRLAEAGLPSYEISNYATPGEECRHNLVYWTGGNYLGLGPSAASHIEGWRWRNRPHIGEWERAITDGTLPATDVEHLSPSRRAGELAMLMLRLTEGLRLDHFQNRTDRSALEVFADPLDRLSRLGLLRVDADAICLTEAGIDVADAVSAEFLDPEESTCEAAQV